MTRRECDEKNSVGRQPQQRKNHFVQLSHRSYGARGQLARRHRGQEGGRLQKMRRSVADCGLARNILFVSVHAGGGDFPKLHSGRKARLHNKHRRRDKSGKKPLSDHSAYGNRRADCGGAQHDGRREEKRRFGGRSYTRKENRFARGGNFRFERRGNFPPYGKDLCCEQEQTQRSDRVGGLRVKSSYRRRKNRAGRTEG